MYNSLGRGFNFLNIPSAATTVVATGKGTLKRIVFNKARLGSTIIGYDELSATGNVLFTNVHPNPLLKNNYFQDFNINFFIGLTIVTNTTDDITVVWS